MWKDAQKELYGSDTVENEHGFITYQKYEDGSAWLKLIYIKKESRGTGEGLNLYRVFCNTENPTTVTGTVDITAKYAEENLFLYLKMGAKIKEAHDNVIIYNLPVLKD